MLWAIANRFPPTLLLIGTSLVIGTVVGIPLGMMAAVRQYSLLDHLMSVIAFLGVSLPAFFAGLLAIYFFSVKWPLFPSGGWQPTGAVGFHFLDLVRHLVLPATVLALIHIATILRYTRSSLLEVLEKEYVMTARAKGLAERYVIVRHALKNTLLPIITVIGLIMPTVIGGASIYRIHLLVARDGHAVCRRRGLPGLSAHHGHDAYHRHRGVVDQPGRRHRLRICESKDPLRMIEGGLGHRNGAAGVDSRGIAGRAGIAAIFAPPLCPRWAGGLLPDCKFVRVGSLPYTLQSKPGQPERRWTTPIERALVWHGPDWPRHLEPHAVRRARLAHGGGLGYGGLYSDRNVARHARGLLPRLGRDVHHASDRCSR